MRYRDLTKRLRELGCQEIIGGRGSHRKWHNPANNKVTVIPDWAAKTLRLAPFAPSFENLIFRAKILVRSNRAINGLIILGTKPRFFSSIS
jgi:predicted RNA binding protein YcfA (HicA-like mRNA interferase family)